jgi:predicted lipoprotein with Yx(FWY)xxD motif
VEWRAGLPPRLPAFGEEAMKCIAIGVAAGLLVAASAFAMDDPAKTMKTSAGEVYTDEKGMTLYVYDKDEAGKSNCYDKCAANWPPFLAASDAKADGAYSLVERKDGTKQWAKDGMPLYYWVKDTKSGDITGDGVGGVWDLAKP